MVNDKYVAEGYGNLTNEQKLKLALYSDFGAEEAKSLFEWLAQNNEPQPAPARRGFRRPECPDGVYYLYEDGSIERFSYAHQNSPTQKVVRIGVKMGKHSLTINLRNQECKLLNTDDNGENANYITEYDDAVADWNGRENTERIKAIGTDIYLDENWGEYIPSVAELYLIYLNKRAINAALALCGGDLIPDRWHWSSTEYSASGAWGLYLGYGYLHGSGKAYTRCVRAVAAFH